MAENSSENKKPVLKMLFDDLKRTVIPGLLDVANSAFVNMMYMLCDCAVDSVSKSVFKKEGSIRQNRNSSNQQTNYSGYSSQRNRSQQTQPPQSLGNRSSQELKYIVAPSEDKANQWQNDLILSIRKYGKVPVSDLYEMAQIKTTMTDYDYGWTNEADIHWQRNRDGWWFNLPRPERIK